MIVGIISAFIATVSFSIFFHVPKSELLFCGTVGALGWMVYLICIHFHFSPVVATFVASLVISQSSSTLAKLRKMPVTIFLIPGIIPLVPGAATYQTMYSLLTEDYIGALEHASFAFQAAAIIVGAIVITTMLPRILSKRNAVG